MPVTIPELLTVATVGDPDDHVPVDGVPVNAVVRPMHNEDRPVMVPYEKAAMVIVSLLPASGEGQGAPVLLT
jgi:hypothetical protein